MKMTLSNQLPEYPVFAEGIRRAPDRGYPLSPAQTVTALKNALRYIPVERTENWLLNFWRSCGPGDESMGTVFVRQATSKPNPSTNIRGTVLKARPFR